jgi:hypothetical protein
MRRGRREVIKYDDLVMDTDVAKVSVVGIGMRSHAGVAATMFKALAAENVNIKVITTSEIKISVLIDRKYMELAVQALHDAFELDKPPDRATHPARQSRPAPPAGRRFACKTGDPQAFARNFADVAPMAPMPLPFPRSLAYRVRNSSGGNNARTDRKRQPQIVAPPARQPRPARQGAGPA